MPSIPEAFEKRLREEYPRLSVRWNNKKRAFEVIERIQDNRFPPERLIWTYENADGTSLPFVGDHCIEFLHSIDTRKWPLKERVRLMREQNAKEREEIENGVLRKIHDHVSDNEIYFSSSERFFMDPKSMPEWKTKYMPSQERVLKRIGAI